MTDEQKEILIAKMLDAPSSLSDHELSLIENDPEMREIYEISSCLSGALAPGPEIDITQEWERFRPRIRKRYVWMRWMTRVAAVFLGVVALSGIIGVCVDRKINEDTPPVISRVAPTEKMEQPAPVVSIASASADSCATSGSPLLPAEVVHPSRSSSHHRVKAKSGVKKTEAEAEAEEIDIDEYLRIQQARIDNDIAMQNAKIYEDEFESMIQLMYVGEAPDKSVICRVTMQ